MKDTIIRKANSSDFNNVLRIFIDSAVLNPKDTGNKELSKYLKNSINDKKTLVLVAVKERELVGVVICKLNCIHEGESLILDLYVIRQMRGKGIGKKLMRALYTLLNKQGIKNLGLNAENNQKTLNFYKKEGFEIGRLIRRCDKIIK